jgi:hypothetical protein
MKFLARSVGALCVLGGLLVGAYLLSLSRPGPVQAGCGPANIAEPTDAPKDSEQSIDQLMERLRTLRAKKAELDRQEKEAITLLREKLNRQRQKLEKLGIAEETPPPPAVGPATPVFPQPPPAAVPVPSSVGPTSPALPPSN